jgi:dihydrofolate reductase
VIALVLVVAVADNGVIGREGALPWLVKSDLRHFRAVTMSKPVVMGRKTYAAIGRPLVGRTNIVVTRNRDFTAPGILVAASLDAALESARGDALRRSADAVAVIGGAEIYRQTLDRADRLVITRIHLRPEGDAQFPPIDSRIWKEVERSDHDAGPEDDASFAVIVYERTSTVIPGLVAKPASAGLVTRARNP